MITIEKMQKIKKEGIANIFFERVLTKIPFIFLFCVIIINYINNKNIFLKITKEFAKNYLLLDNRVEMLITVSVVVIGFYITVISVFGSNYSIAIVKVSEFNKTNDYIKYAERAVISAFFHFIMLIFYDLWIAKNQIFIFIYLTLFSWLIATFIRFSSITFKMYKYNIKKAYELLEKEKRDKEDLLILINKIKNMLEVRNINNEEYFKRLQEESRRQYEEGEKIEENI